MSKGVYGLEKYDHIKNLIKAAEKVPAAKYKLALLYLEGNEIGRDVKKAVTLLEESAKSHKEAAYALGVMYFKGDEVDQDLNMGIKLIENSATKGSDKGLYKMGILYKLGENIEKDIVKSEEYFSKIPKGSELYKDALYELGKIYLYEKNKFIEAQKYLINGYKEGSAEAAYLLGKTYYEGQYTEADYKVSYKYVDYAASKGHVDGILLKSEFYIKGVGGVEQDKSEGVKLLEIASEKGSDEAKYRLVELNLEESGSRHDKEKAKTMLKEMASDGHGRACYMLSQIYFEEGDKKEGEEWLRKSASFNDIKSQMILGKIILKGCDLSKNEGITGYLSQLFAAESKGSCSKGLEWIGQASTKESDLILGQAYIEGKYGNKKIVEIDQEKGIEYLKKAISNGIVKANYLLGRNILERSKEITDKDRKKGVGEIEYAVSKGDIESKCYLGELKYEGKHVDQNPEKGRELMREAAEAGYYKAQYILGKMYYEETPKVNCKKAIYWLEAAREVSRMDAIKEMGLKYNVVVVDGLGIKSAYHNISKKVHPDQNRDKSEDSEIKEDFNKLVKLNEDKYSNEDLEKLVDYDLYNDIEYMMGEMFYQGCLDLDKNIAEAEKWYKKGGDNGNELALYKSYEVYEESKDNNQLRDVDESTEL